MNDPVELLSFLTAAQTAEERKTGEFYLLQPDYALRGYTKPAYGLLNLKTGRLVPMTELELTAARICNGQIDINGFAVTPSLRRAVERLVQRGLARACRYKETLLPEQELLQQNIPYIYSVKWALTGRCNLRCRHCFVSAPEAKLGELSHKDCMRLIGEMADCGVSRVQLTGGEPLVRDDFFEILEELTRKNIRVTSIATNGVLVTERFVRRLEDTGVHPAFFMSFDGVGRHDWLRGAEGLEKQLLSRFELLADCGYYTGSAMTLHRGNLPVLRESVNALAKVGCRQVIVNRMLAFGEWAKQGREYALTPKELYDTYMLYIPQFYADGLPVKLVLNRFFQTLQPGCPDYELIPIARCHGKDEALCGATAEYPYLAADGQLMPCLNVAAQRPACLHMPDCTAMSLKEALCDEGYLAATALTCGQFYDRHPECAGCPYKALCSGGCRAFALEQSPEDYLAKDPVNCMFFREGYPERIMQAVKSACATARCINYHG